MSKLPQEPKVDPAKRGRRTTVVALGILLIVAGAAALMNGQSGLGGALIDVGIACCVCLPILIAYNGRRGTST